MPDEHFLLPGERDLLRKYGRFWSLISLKAITILKTSEKNIYE